MRCKTTPVGRSNREILTHRAAQLGCLPIGYFSAPVHFSLQRSDLMLHTGSLFPIASWFTLNNFWKKVNIFPENLKILQICEHFIKTWTFFDKIRRIYEIFGFFSIFLKRKKLFKFRFFLKNALIRKMLNIFKNCEQILNLKMLKVFKIFQNSEIKTFLEN